MFYLETQQLMLVATPLDVIKKRLTHDDTFTADMPVANGPRLVTFPATWPGDALVIFPRLIDHLEKNPGQELWDGTLIERAILTAAGQLGAKGAPDENGVVEIGYNVSPAFQGRGYATEMVGALSAWLLDQPGVTQVTAECLETNVASARVLQKTGFELVCKRAGDEGPLLVWVRSI